MSGNRPVHHTQILSDDLAAPSHRIVELGIAHVPENHRLFPRMTVEDNLRMGGFIPQAIGPDGVQKCTSMCRCSLDVPSLKPWRLLEILSYLVHWHYIFDNKISSAHNRD